VAIRARSLTAFRKLGRVGVFVAIFTNLRRALELHRFLARRHFVTSGAIYGPVSPEQQELGL